MVTGAGGQLGSDLVAVLSAAGDEVVGLTRADLDLTDADAVRRAVADAAPDVVVNAAAYTAVDDAETDESAAAMLNGDAPGVLAAAVDAAGGRLLHVSTDYVFDGRATTPYEVDAPVAPASAYGRTKAAGERAVREASPERGYVVRTAWVYGATGGNFVKTMTRLEGSHPTVSVVDDQRGSPTWSRDLAEALVALGRSDAPAGTYHATNAGETTWYGFTRAIFAELGADPERVRPTTTDAFPRPAPRPAYSVLSDRAWRDAGLPPLPAWDDALHRAFTEIGDRLRSG